MQQAGVRDGPRAMTGRWAPLIVVVTVIALIVGGAQVLARAVNGTASDTVHVGDVDLRPRPGWDVESVTTSPATARLHRGAVVLDVLASGADATGPASIAVRYVEQQLRPRLPQVLPASPEFVVLGDGAPAARVAYIGVTSDGLPIEGVVTAVAGSTSSAVFDAVAPRGELIGVAEDVQAMIEGAVVP
jgi:hypothetical protein